VSDTANETPAPSAREKVADQITIGTHRLGELYLRERDLVAALENVREQIETVARDVVGLQKAAKVVG